MPTKFVNILETSKLRIRGQSLGSVSYVLLHLLTLRLYENLAPEPQPLYQMLPWTQMDAVVSLNIPATLL